jgi:hypothetical protein
VGCDVAEVEDEGARGAPLAAATAALLLRPLLLLPLLLRLLGSFTCNTVGGQLGAYPGGPRSWCAVSDTAAQEAAGWVRRMAAWVGSGRLPRLTPAQRPAQPVLRPEGQRGQRAVRLVAHRRTDVLPPARGGGGGGHSSRLCGSTRLRSRL